jgi:hypothetical protein
MDALASVGKGYSTFQLIIAVIFSLGMIAGGIYLLSTDQQPIQPPSLPPLGPGMPPTPPMPSIPVSNTPRMIGGAVMIVIGVLSPIAAWIRRKVIRSNPLIASLAGAIDVARLVNV